MNRKQMASFVAEWEPKGPWVVEEQKYPKGWCVLIPAGVVGGYAVTVGAYYVLQADAHRIAAILNWGEVHE